MCGIAGILASGPFDDKERVIANLAAMTAQLRHRGPDAGGEWIDPEGAIAFGHRRLSILDLSEAGSQPMVSASGRYVITYNGEIYNHLELRRDLATQGHAPAWRGTSDTETILACIEAWGIERALGAFRGMFAFGLWDKSERSLILARDRMGEKPLYYGKVGNGFVFGSELRALKAHSDFANIINRDAVALLLAHNYIPAPYSIFDGISKLPAGTWLKVDGWPNGSIQPVKYWSLASVAETGASSLYSGSEQDAAHELEGLFEDVVRSQMISDVPLGAFLSGGIDSSLIVALMQRVSTAPVHTFSIGFEELGFNEAAHAKAVAEHLGTRHTEIVLTQKDALDTVDALDSITDEPFADSSQIPTLLLSKLTREHVTVAMSGDGGDELFGGYNRYVWVPRLWRKVGWMPPALRNVAAEVLERVPASAGSRLEPAFRSLSTHFGLPITFGSKISRIGSILRDTGSADDVFVNLVSEWPDGVAIVKGSHCGETLLSERARWPRLATITDRMMAVDSLTYLPDDILAKVDRSAMANSLETRAPFLDPRIVEFAWHLPVEMKIGRDGGKKLLRTVLYRHVPREMIERPKQGFAIPLDQWLRGELRDWVEALLSEERLKGQGIFDPEPIRAAWSDHIAQKRNNGLRLWSILMFQSWLEKQ